MATSEGQDVIRCELCENPVAFHCNLCITGLCENCVLKHMSDKTKKHEVVEFKNRKENLVYPKCKSHESKCETYCRGCKVPVCIKCIISMHKDHDVTEIEEIVQRQRKCIEADTQKLREKVENIQMREENTAGCNEALDKATSDITQRENEIFEMAHDVAEKMRKEVAEKKEQNKVVNAVNQFKVFDVKRKLQRAIANNGELLQSRNMMDFVNYRDTNGNLNVDLKLAGNLYPLMPCSEIHVDQIRGLFATLSFQKDKREIFHLTGKPEVLATIPSHHSKLWRLLCVGNGKIWTSGDGTTVRQIDKHGNILLSIESDESPSSLSVDSQQCLVFSKWNDTTVNVYKDGNVQTHLNKTNWLPRGICHTRNGDMLVSLRLKDEYQSKVARYSGTTETQTIQYDGQGQPLFSTGSAVLLLIENGNGDVCVSDYDGKEVVVVNASGGLRFKYRGNLSKESKHTEFKPSKIAADVNHHILINDSVKNNVQIVNSDGNFIRYIEYPCNGGLSIDADHNLVIGDSTSGKIKIIKYLQ